MTADNENLDETEARQADDPGVGSGSPASAPHELPAPVVAEPVAIGAGVSVLAVVGALLGAGVPWYGAVGLAVVLVLVAAWQRQQVTPAR